MLNGHSWGAISGRIRGTNIISHQIYASIFNGKRREVCADNGSDHELFDVKDDNKGPVMHIGDSSASITGVKWRIWWFAPASSACYQMRTMA